MNMNKHSSWIKKLRFLLPEKLRASPFGGVPKLHLADLEPILKKHLHAAETSVEMQSISTSDLDTIYHELGPEPFEQAVQLEPVKAPVFLLFRGQDIEKGHLYFTKGNLPSSTEIFKGVVKFLALKGLATIEEMHLFKGLSMTLATAQPSEGLFEVFDFLLQIPGLSLTPKLIVPVKTLEKINEFYHHHPVSHQEDHPDIDVPVHIELGEVRLTQKEIKSLEALDLVHLEGISREVLDKNYLVHICYQDTPLLSAEYKDAHLHRFTPFSVTPQEKFMSSRDHEDEEETFDDEKSFEHQEDEGNLLEDGEELDEQRARAHHTTPHTKAHKKNVVLDEIALNCKIELGSIAIPYKTLAHLNSESTLKVDLDPKTVYLTLNGQILRRGEIVEFDQQLFFKVLE